MDWIEAEIKLMEAGLLDDNGKLTDAANRDSITACLGKSGLAAWNNKPKGAKLEKRMVDPSEIRPGPIQHANLNREQLALCAYTYKWAGKYIQPTLEQWELGFMRDLHADRELSFWGRVSIAIQKLADSGIAPKEIVAALAAKSMDSSRTLAPAVDEAWNSIDDDDCQRAIRTAFTDAGIEIGD